MGYFAVQCLPMKQDPGNACAAQLAVEFSGLQASICSSWLHASVLNSMPIPIELWMGSGSGDMGIAVVHAMRSESQISTLLHSVSCAVWAVCMYVVGWWVMFCEIIGKVVIAFWPLDFVLALADLVFYPVKLHIHCFGLFDFYHVNGKALHCVDVHDNECRFSLEMSKLGEDVSDMCPYWPLMNSVLVSALDADAMVFRMILLLT